MWKRLNHFLTVELRSWNKLEILAHLFMLISVGLLIYTIWNSLDKYASEMMPTIYMYITSVILLVISLIVYHLSKRPIKNFIYDIVHELKSWNRWDTLGYLFLLTAVGLIVYAIWDSLDKYASEMMPTIYMICVSSMLLVASRLMFHLSIRVSNKKWGNY